MYWWLGFLCLWDRYKTADQVTGFYRPCCSD